MTSGPTSSRVVRRSNGARCSWTPAVWPCPVRQTPGPRRTPPRGNGQKPPRGDQLATLAVGALCFDPNPSPAGSSVAYLGTGEGGSTYGAMGQGVYRSTDGGRSWALHATVPFVGSGFFALVVDLFHSDTLYAGTESGLFVSRDAAVTWRKARVGPRWSVSVDPHEGAGEVLAAGWDGVFRSTDTGETWNRTTVTLDATRGRSRFREISSTRAKWDTTGTHTLGRRQHPRRPACDGLRPARRQHPLCGLRRPM